MTDTPEFYAILTEAGRALQFECLDSEKTFVMTEVAVGDGNGSYYEPEKTQTNLKNERYRHAITRSLTDKKGLVKSVILDIPEQISGFTVREVGVYGENGDLLIIGKCPATEKRTPESGAPSQLAIKVDLTQINELVLPVLIDPSVNTASVQYVEEHFQALNEKGLAGGYAPLDPTAKVPQEMVQKPLTPFCFNAGLVDASGKAACVTVANNTLTLAAGSVCTSAGGTTYTVPEDVSIDISSLSEGDHNFAYDAENQTIEEYSKVIVSATEPQDFSVGVIWLDNSVMPYTAKMKNTSGEIVAREIIPLPAKLDISTVSDGGGGLTLMPKIYNDNKLSEEYLPLTGGLLTGKLDIKDAAATLSLYSNTPIGSNSVFTRVNWLDSMNPPDSEMAYSLGRLRCFDKNGLDIGCFQIARHPQRNAYYAEMYSRNNICNKSSNIRALVLDDGTIETYAPNVTNAGGIVTQTEVTKAQNGCIGLGNGIMFQWGKTSAANNVSRIVTFREPFPTATAIVLMQPIGGDDNNWAGKYYCAQSYNSTNFKYTAAAGANGGYFWLAIGY